MMRYRWIWAFVLLLIPTAVVAQTPIELHWEQYDNVVDVQRDGSLRIREQQVLVVDQGTLSRMTREFETGSAGRVTNMRVSENGESYDRSSSQQPGTYVGSDNGDIAQIQLFFRDPTVARHEITIEYTVQDGLVADNERAQLNWNFFWATPDAPPIDNGSVVINFPQAVDPANLQVDTAGPSVQQRVEGNTLRLTLTEPIQGQQLEVGTAFPRTVLAANAQLRSPGQNAQPNAPVGRDPAPQPASPGAAPAVGFDPIFCFVLIFILFIAFSIISSSARRRRRGGYGGLPPTVYGPDPFGGAPYGGRRRRRRRHGGWGWGFPPIIIPPPNIGHDNRPFNGPFDDPGSGGSSSDWGDSGGSSSGWGDSGGGSSSWGDSGGSSSSWGSMGGGSSSWGGDGGGGGNDRGGGGSGGGSFG